MPLLEILSPVSGTMDTSSFADQIDVTKGVLDEAIDILGEIDKIADLVEGFAKFLGPASAVLSLVIVFLPAADSEELAYMKESFSKVFDQLEAIEGKINDLKTIVAWENQKGQYVKDFHAINFGFAQVQKMMDELGKVPCTQKSSCERAKTKIASAYFHRRVFDVEKNVYHILDGMLTKGSQIVSYIPGLLAEHSKCDIPKLRVPQTLT